MNNPETLELVYNLIEEVCKYNNNVCMATNEWFSSTINRNHRCGLVKKEITEYIKELKNQNRVLVLPGQNRRIFIVKNVDNIKV